MIVLALGQSCDAAADKEDALGRTGDTRRTVACTLANQCHGYRNATLDDRHLDTAKRILTKFR